MEIPDRATQIRRSWWFSPGGLLLLAALLSSAFAWVVIAAPVALLRNTGQHVGHFELLYVHMLGGTIMLLVGAINLYIGSTRQHFKYHKLAGRTYLIGGALAAVIAAMMALSPAHKGDTPLMFTNAAGSLVALSAAWLATAGMAYRAVRNRRYDSHREWIIRSYVLAWSFVFCRLASRVPAVAEFGEGNAFIWLSWVAPLFLCEVVLQWRAGSSLAVSTQTPGAKQ
jgi:Predicted membrane protein (DUF2306)